MPPPTLTPSGGSATALFDAIGAGPLAVVVLALLILAGPYVRRDTARLLRAAAEVLDTPARR